MASDMQYQGNFNLNKKEGAGKIIVKYNSKLH